jgi:sorbitol-specific phosphotransferase system component IIBC
VWASWQRDIFDRHGSLRCALLPVNNIPLPTRHVIRQLVARGLMRFISDDKHLSLMLPSTFAAVVGGSAGGAFLAEN